MASSPIGQPGRKTDFAALPVHDGDILGDGKFRDHCGVVGIAAQGEVAPYLYYALQSLQHRGQESCGITTLDGLYELRTHKQMGLVDQVFDPGVIKKLRGSVGIGHARYSTSAGSTEENAQPQVVMSGQGGIALAHNGNIPNTNDLMEELKAKGWAFYSGNDTEVVVRLLANKLVKHEGNHVGAIQETMGRLQGSYAFALLVGSELYGVRDPWGIKPLCIGRLPTGGHMVASESVALDVVGAEFVRDVKPGEVVRVRKGGVETVAHLPAAKPARCFFEYVYFARPDAWMDGRLNQEVRERIGRILAKESPTAADIVVPVPDSGRSHAQGYAAESGLPYQEALMKNRYVHRTFIMPTQEARELNVRLKLNPMRHVLEGKRVVLTDDSIVRGTTMKRIVQMVRAAGAREVHVRIGCPPIVAPCYLGIDMNTREELVGASKTVKEIETMIGADSLAYISQDGLIDALGFPKDELCLGCISGRYPVPVPGEHLRDGSAVPGIPPEPTCC
ncbi:MAG TPA: amidophosphoribosyltransferase [Candidatus Thermoplasmatota archaeon]|nr:amidophosphoribosyltransferase [Candidatus Thermoplasmatota archaeon]